MICKFYNLSQNDNTVILTIGACRNKWKDWKFNIWCWIHSIFWILLVLTSLGFYLFFLFYPAIRLSEVEPKKILANDILEMEFGANDLRWISLEMEIRNCSGQVDIFRGTNCSILSEAIRVSMLGDTNRWHGYPPKYSLQDSSFEISDLYSTLIILKSLASFSAYQKLCKDLGDFNDWNICKNNLTVQHLCMENHSISLLRMKEDFWCFNETAYRLGFMFTIQVPDYYSVIIPIFARKPLIKGTIYTYDPSLISTLDYSKETHNFSKLGAERNFVSFSISGLFPFASQENCVVLQSICAENVLIDYYNISYSFQRERGVLVFPSLFVLPCLLAWFAMVGCHVGHVHGGSWNCCARGGGGNSECDHFERSHHTVHNNGG